MTDSSAPLPRVTAHFHQPPTASGAVNVAAELRQVPVPYVATLSIRPQGWAWLEAHFVVVRQPSDLDHLADRLRDEEFAVGPTYSAEWVDACATRGIFPMTLHMGVSLFAPKLHVERAVVNIAGTKNHSPISCDRRIAKRCGVRVNHEADLVPVLQMIYYQHGNNWLNAEMRGVLHGMFRSPNTTTTRVVVMALRDRNGGGVVAGEVGYIVGDVYTSMTGAYIVHGAGSVQLAALAAVLKRRGVSVWDLGMKMKYKEEALKCNVLSRSQWQALVSERRTCDVSPLAGEWENAADLIFPPRENAPPVPESKSQQKKAARALKRHQREENSPLHQRLHDDKPIGDQ